MLRQGKKTNKNFGGFTLLEMLVALAIFSIAITLSLSALLALTGSQRKAISIQNVYDNIRFSFEAMTKEIRTGASYSCGAITNAPLAAANPQSCPGGGAALTFENSDGQTVTYQIRDGKIQRGVAGSQFFDVTAQEVRIDGKSLFYVFGAEGGDYVQPRVSIVLDAFSGAEGPSRSMINLQTIVTQRNPEQL